MAPPIAPNLLLAGDVGLPTRPLFRAFMQYCARTFDTVLYVPGSHEYFATNEDGTTGLRTRRETEALLRALLSDLPNVHVLVCGEWRAKDGSVVVLGCPLWTHLNLRLYLDADDEVAGQASDKVAAATTTASGAPTAAAVPAAASSATSTTPPRATTGATTSSPSGREAGKSVEESLSALRLQGATYNLRAPPLRDFDLSLADDGARGPRPLTPRTYNAEHAAQRAWLARRLAAPENAACKRIVLTHHLPSLELVSPTERHPLLNDALASDCSDLLAKAHSWVCGHSHHASDVVLHGCRVLMNPFGLPIEQRIPRGYRTACTLDV